MFETPRSRFARSPLRLFVALAALSVLAACGGPSTSYHTARHYKPGRYYPPPGPASDPWGPYIHEASGRFGVPEQWVRAVMHQESGGHEFVISWAGALGLMQVMPDTYDELRTRYSLGEDPFDPHNNILAGTAYLREMYDRYGSPGFLAAYNAGPNRLDRYLARGAPLPTETINYVASIGPHLGAGSPMSGPLAVYARGYDTEATTRLASARGPIGAGCDPDAAYNPDGPCTPLPEASPAPDLQTASAEPVGGAAMPSRAPTPADCDPDAAYDPSRPCQPRPEQPAQTSEPPASEPPASQAPTSQAMVRAEPLMAPNVAPRPSNPAAPRYAESRPPTPRRYASASPEVAEQPPVVGGARPIQETMPQPALRSMTARRPLPKGHPTGPQWAIQVGTFASLAAAEAAADNARTLLPDSLGMAKIELLPTAPLGSHVAFQARLAGLSPATATAACHHLSGHGMACLKMPSSAS
jgi:D-alanyl-D-alanine carboxypeptidase